MLLAIDIGNTNITLGIFKGEDLLCCCKMPTGQGKKADEYYKEIKRLFKNKKGCAEKITGVIICSVVPKALLAFKKGLKKLVSVEPLVLGENIQAPIENLYDEPKQVGQDRLVAAVAAKKIYGAPVIVVDFGTAITFDLVSKRGQYMGGVIVPGLEIALDTLSARAALLPTIQLVKKDVLLGKNTRDSMLSGILNGYGSLTDGLVHKLKKAYGGKAKVVATGGNAELIATYCKSISYVNKTLVIEGLQLIYEQSD